jgi:hypothetical protein
MTNSHKILAVSLVALVILGFMLSKKNADTPSKIESPDVNADTLIPHGYVLVPLELANLAAVAGLINQYGVVDLYAESKLVASHVKILRAPLNPNQYAALVTENISRELMQYKMSFWAVVQNRNVSTALPPQPSPTAASAPIAVELEKIKPVTIRQRKNLTTKVEIEYYQEGIK